MSGLSRPMPGAGRCLGCLSGPRFRQALNAWCVCVRVCVLSGETFPVFLCFLPGMAKLCLVSVVHLDRSKLVFCLPPAVGEFRYHCRF